MEISRKSLLAPWPGSGSRREQGIEENAVQGMQPRLGSSGGVWACRRVQVAVLVPDIQPAPASPLSPPALRKTTQLGPDMTPRHPATPVSPSDTTLHCSFWTWTPPMPDPGTGDARGKGLYQWNSRS